MNKKKSIYIEKIYWSTVYKKILHNILTELGTTIDGSEEAAVDLEVVDTVLVEGTQGTGGTVEEGIQGTEEEAGIL